MFGCSVNATEALDLWRRERIGPYSEPTGPRHQILWSRLPSNSSLLKEYKDPAAGPHSPHFEITLSVMSPFPLKDRLPVLKSHLGRRTCGVFFLGPFDASLSCVDARGRLTLDPA